MTTSLSSLKKSAAALSAAVLMTVSGSALSGGVPVFDGIALTQAIQQFLQLKMQYDQLVRQYDQQITSYNQQLRQFNSMTGNRNYASANSTQAQRDFVSPDLQVTMTAVRSRGADALPAGARTLYNQLQFAERCGRIGSERMRALCVRRGSLIALNSFASTQGAQRASERSNSISGFINTIGSTSDAKGIAEVQARIAQESAALDNERARLELLKQSSEAEREILAEEQKAFENHLLGG